MDLMQFGDLAAQAIVNILFASVIMWLFAKHLPEKEKEFSRRLSEVIDKLSGETAQERTMFKDAQKETVDELRMIRKELQSLVTVIISETTDNPRRARELHDEIIRNGD